MLAQALVEHGMLSSLAAAVTSASAAVENYVRDLDTPEVVGALAIVAFVWWVSRR